MLLISSNVKLKNRFYLDILNIRLYLKVTCFFFSLLTLSACHIFKMDIRQGNQLEEKTLNQLRPRQTIIEVQEILGTANLNPNSPNRLDYYYSFNPNKNGITKKQHITLFFDQNGELNHYKGDIVIKNLPKAI